MDINLIGHKIYSNINNNNEIATKTKEVHALWGRPVDSDKST